MLHSRRTYRVTRVDDLDELAQMLTEMTHTLCTAFQHGDLTFFNDALSEDGAQEYAVVRGGQQIESITCSWMTTDQMRDWLTFARTAQFDPLCPASPNTHHPDEPCPLCI